MEDKIPEYIAKIVESEVAKRAYDQGLSGTISEIGKMGTNVVKTLRLFTLPLQLASTLQDRISASLNRVRDKVPVERQQQSPPQIAGPVFEHMRYLDEEDVLTQMFEELLARSIDRDRIKEAHPSFVHLISQLSRDEALILLELRSNNFEVVDVLDLDRKQDRFVNRRVEKSTIPADKLFYPENVELYYSHLESLSLVQWPVFRQDPIPSSGTQTGIRRFSKMHLTEFGKLFVSACIPDSGFRL